MREIQTPCGLNATFDTKNFIDKEDSKCRFGDFLFVYWIDPKGKLEMKLYGTPPTRALRVVWLLNELQLDCEVISVNMRAGENHTSEFLALNPAGKVPVLVDGDLVLSESSAIQLYLAEKCPDARLIPTDLKTRALMYQWIFFLVTEIEQPLWRIARNMHIYDEKDRQPQDIEIATRECLAMVQVLEKHMQGRQFLVGDQLSVADLNAAYTLDWAQMAKMLEQAPRLKDYLARIYSRETAPMTIEEAFAKL
jgi:glutathione S-transferase